MSEHTQQDHRILEIATRILPGLLASGHYTRRDTETSADVLRFDNGKDWQQQKYSRQHESWAVGDALDLAAELLETHTCNVAARKEAVQ